MNYRRGLQRLYAVLTVAWVASLLFVLPSERLTFWIPPIDYGRHSIVQPDAPGTIPTFEEFKTRRDATTASSSSGGAGKDRTSEIERYGSASDVPMPPKGAIPVPPTANGWTVVKEASLTNSDVEKLDAANPAISGLSWVRKIMWLAGILFLPPVAGYAAMFLIIPWIYRGFRPRALV